MARRGERNPTYETILQAIEEGAVALPSDAALERTLRGFDLRPRPAEDVLAGVLDDVGSRPGDPLALDSNGQIVRAGPGQHVAGTFIDYINAAPTAGPSGVDLRNTMGQIRAALGVHTVQGTPIAGARPTPPRLPLPNGWAAGDRARVRLPDQPEIDGRICAVEGLAVTTDPPTAALTVRCLGRGREHLTGTVPLDTTTGAVLGDALERVEADEPAAFIPGDRVAVALQEADPACGTVLSIGRGVTGDDAGYWVRLDGPPERTAFTTDAAHLTPLPGERPAPVEMGVDLAAPPARARTLIVRYADGEERRTSGTPDELAAAIQALATVPGVTWERAE